METPALEHLVGAYFHLDWADEFDDDPWRALDAFISGTPDLAPRVPEEVSALLRELPTDDEVGAYLAALGSAFTPSREDSGYRGWLTEVARRVREATT